MPKREAQELVRKHLWLNKEDWDWIVEKFGPANIKPSNVVRTVLSGYIRTMKAKEAEANAQLSNLGDFDIELDEEELRAD